LSRFPVLEKRIGHRFANAALLEQALTHRSYGSPHNERLEFLGDGVLGCIVTEELFRRFPQATEGKLTQAKAELVRQGTLAGLARAVGLPDLLHLGEGASRSGSAERDSVLADALEAVFGAVFLDGGYAAVRGAILATYGEVLAGVDVEALKKSPKNRLQEYLHARGHGLPKYVLRATRGPKQQPVFEVECLVAELGLAATGEGPSRQAAEKQAAEYLLRQLE
jgi:ribonuclease-3